MSRTTQNGLSSNDSTSVKINNFIKWISFFRVDPNVKRLLYSEKQTESDRSCLPSKKMAEMHGSVAMYLMYLKTWVMQFVLMFAKIWVCVFTVI